MRSILSVGCSSVVGMETAEVHPAVARLKGAIRVLDDTGDVPVWSLSGEELDGLIGMQLSLQSRLDAELAVSLEQATAVDRPAELAAPGMVAWLRGRFGLSPARAGQLMRQVTALRNAPTAAAAARTGDLATECAVEIGQAVAALPPEVGPELLERAERLMIGFARGSDGESALDAVELRWVGRHLHELLDPETAERLLAERLEREEADTYRRRFLSLTADGTGGVRLRGLLTAEAGAILAAVLDPLSDPTRRPRADMTPLLEAGGGGAADRTPDSAEDSAEPVVDERTYEQRQADALVEAAQRLLAQGELPTGGGERPQIVVTLDHAALVAGGGAATLPDGSELPVSTVRRLACDAGVLPAVLGTTGQVLDLGRSARTASPAQRRALGIRDGGCAFPGCDRPPSWAEAHHIREWADLGPTDLSNLVLLCCYHHRVVHHEDWAIEPAVAGGRPLFVPPAWIDPGRRPRRNHRHHPRDLFHTPPEPPP
jgi:hypothetical protein